MIFKDYSTFINEEATKRRRGINLAKDLSIGGDGHEKFYFQDADMQNILQQAKKIEISIARQTQFSGGINGYLRVYDKANKELYDDITGTVLDYWKPKQICNGATTVEEVCRKIFGSTDAAKELIDRGVTVTWHEFEDDEIDLKDKIKDPSEPLEFAEDTDT